MWPLTLPVCTPLGRPALQPHLPACTLAPRASPKLSSLHSLKQPLYMGADNQQSRFRASMPWISLPSLQSQGLPLLPQGRPRATAEGRGSGPGHGERAFRALWERGVGGEDDGSSHSFTQILLPDNLLGAGGSARCWEHRIEQQRQDLCPVGACGRKQTLKEESQDDQKINVWINAHLSSA